MRELDTQNYRNTDKRRLNDTREEIGMSFTLTGRIVRHRKMGAGHLLRMEEDRLPMKADVMKQPGRSKKGRPQLKWENYKKRDYKKGREGLRRANSLRTRRT